MNKEQFDFSTKSGEGFRLEFKESFDSKDLSKEIVAFANGEGGNIFLGVDDKGEVKGIKITNKLKSQIQDIARNCDPDIKIKIIDYENVLIIEVEEGKDKPHKCSQGFFIRQGPNSQKMKRDDIIDLMSSAGKLKFDNKFTDVDKYDKKILNEYLKKAGIVQKITKSTLFNLGVADKNGFLNNAGVLFFTNNPKKYLINAYITCARYKGTEKVNVIDRKDFEGDLVSQVERSIEFVKRNTRLEYEIKGLYRKEIPEYPIEAVREAILNAVMHRDYFERGANVQIDIFDDRLTITNIGGLIKPLTKKILGTLAIRRNPIIADLFHRIHLVEKMGTGIDRIKEECEKYDNIKLKFETNGYFIIIFGFKNNVPENVPERRIENIKELMRKNNKITITQIAERLNVNEKTIKRDIDKLKELEIIKRIGPDKGGHWEVFDEE